MKLFLVGLCIFSLSQSACAGTDGPTFVADHVRNLPEGFSLTPPIPVQQYAPPTPKAPNIKAGDSDEIIALKLAEGWLGFRPETFENHSPKTVKQMIRRLKRLQDHPEELNHPGTGPLWHLADAAYKKLKNIE
jgi:hypothetical protein